MANLSSTTPALLIWSVFCAAVSAKALPEPDGGSSNMTELQMHVSFFDRNKDGVLTPLETFQGFVAIGCEIAFSTAAASTIHTILPPFTNPPGALPPYVNIYVEYIHKAIHGSDTGAYDSKGRAAEEGEWQLIYQLAHDRNGFLTKERARGIYNGDIFAQLEAERSRRPLHSNERK